MNTPLNIGIMGCANIAERMLLPALLEIKNLFHIQAIASRNLIKAQAFTDKFGGEARLGYESLLSDDIDAVYMPLPTGLHKEWIEKCILAGKPVLLEKSFALNYHDSKYLIDLARSRQIVLMEDFMFQYHSQHNFVFEQLNKGEIGSLNLFRAQFGFPPLAEGNFRYDMQMGGGALLDAGAYTIKAAQWFLGNDLEVLSANLYISKQKNSDVAGNATLMNKSGLTAQLSWGFQHHYQCNYELWGTKGKIYLEKSFTPKPDEQPGVQFERALDKQRLTLPADNHFKNILTAFHANILKRQYETNLEAILNQSRLLQAVSDQAKRFEIA